MEKTDVELFWLTQLGRKHDIQLVEEFVVGRDPNVEKRGNDAERGQPGPVLHEFVSLGHLQKVEFAFVDF